MKTIITSFILLSNLIGYSQIDPIEEYQRAVESKNRVELNKNDSVFIEEFISTIDSNNCFQVDSLINSHYFSNILVYEIVKNLLLLNDTLCFRVILNNISYFEQHPNSLRYKEIDNFPVAKAAYSNTLFMTNLATYILNSNYFDSCNLFQELPKEKIKFLKALLDAIDINFDDINEVCCRKLNIINVSRL